MRRSDRADRDPGVLHGNAQVLSVPLLADLFVGPADQLGWASEERACVVFANHTWQLDGLCSFLATGFLRRRYQLLASPRFGRLPRSVAERFGIHPLSESGIRNAATLRSLRDRLLPRDLLWVFPQGVWIPPHWDPSATVVDQAELLVRLLGKRRPLVPVHWEILHVRKLRPAVVATFGNPVEPAATANTSVGEVLADLRSEARRRLRGACTEYLSVRSGERFLFCGYPITGREIRAFLSRKWPGVSVRIEAGIQRWRVSITGDSVNPDELREELHRLLPGVLADRFIEGSTIEVGEHGAK